MGMETVQLDAIRSCLEGVIPAAVATCSAEGVPNATYVSQMQYVDARHVALSFQFFSKTRQNVLANPQVTALVIDPVTAAAYRLELLYLRTETAGALFQSLKAKLAGIASHVGMVGVFKLQGADVYRVLRVERVPGPELKRPPPERNLLNALRQSGERLAACTDLDALFDQLLVQLSGEFGIEQALLLMADEDGRRLFLVGSRGYASSGIGSEIQLGEGVIGVAAQYRTAIRINHMTSEYLYGSAGRGDAAPEAEIPFPGLAEPHSQLAVPILLADRLLGVLCVESAQDLRFGYDDEDALVALATQLGLQIALLQQQAECGAATAVLLPAGGPVPPSSGQPLELRHYAGNDSVFVAGDYLIKGVAGAILWKLVREYQAGRCEFTNRELRMAPELRLPDVSDNLEARLILLQRRLAERCPSLAFEKTGRGQFRLCVARPLRLVEAEG
ncbi:GAF domain-containing protein [Paucibacter sp. JuS9]|uniref:GAF domain-containing protein n=1 Tax=Paucibacter sp. JuS9 TaxID=3228748 RepID=UPI0037566BD6